MTNKLETLSRIEDYVLDMHTPVGRRMGRGQKHWLETSSETINKKEEYQKWRAWFQPLMLKIEQGQKYYVA